MKSVLISIKPKWCELIASGKKTVEVRKTRPKLETPYKCYIYCTASSNYLPDTLIKDEYGIWLCHADDYNTCRPKPQKLNRTIIGEFVCDMVHDLDYLGKPGKAFTDSIITFSCLSYDEIMKYKNGKNAYGWHISDLVIYDEPKKLSEFWAYNEDFRKLYDNDDDFCCYDGRNEYGETTTDCVDAYQNITNCYRCWEEWSGWCHKVKHPPQSWSYVEELP